MVHSASHGQHRFMHVVSNPNVGVHSHPSASSLPNAAANSVLNTFSEAA
jgi:hypothetical protein